MEYQGMTAQESDYLDFLKDDLDQQTRLAWFAFEYALAVEAEYEGEQCGESGWKSTTWANRDVTETRVVAQAEP